MKTTTIDFVRLHFSCEDCDEHEPNVPISEAVYNGPPVCPNCHEEMSIESQVDLLE